MRTTSVSIVIPTYNEESTIETLLSHLLEIGADEILVVDGNSSDRTRELVRRYAVRLLQTRTCRAEQMNTGARASQGGAILFLHSDVCLEPGAIRAIRTALRNPAICGGNLHVCYEGNDLAAAIFTRINHYRQRLGIFYGDSGIFCRRSVFESLGGFQPWPILEDYEFARRLWKSGPLAFLDAPIHVSNRRWRGRGILATLWIWSVIQGLYLVGVSPHRLARLYAAVR